MRILLYLLLLPLLFSCSSKSPVAQPTPVDTLGTGWKKISMPDMSYGDIFFINNNTGYVVGGGSIYRSSDGGNTWQKVHQASSAIVNIAMGSESNAVFVSTNGNQLLFTKNGGTSFDSVNINTDIILDAFFVNANTVYAVGNKFWKSTDAGSTWTKLYDFTISAGPYRSLYFLNDQYGWMAGEGGPYRTINGGTSWEAKPSPDLSFFAGNAFFLDINNGYVSDGRSVAKTSNAGNSWSRVLNGTSGYQDLHFISATTGYVADGTYIFKTQDGGANWKKEVVLPGKNIIEIHFTDASHGWACGTDGILKFQN